MTEPMSAEELSELLLRDPAERPDSHDLLDMCLATIRALQAQLARCGGDNCMGFQVDGVATWVRAERLAEAEQEAERLRRALWSVGNETSNRWIRKVAREALAPRETEEATLGEGG